MRAFINTALLIMALESGGKLHMIHQLTQGDGPIVRKRGHLLVDIVCSIGRIIWGLYILN